MYIWRDSRRVQIVGEANIWYTYESLSSLQKRLPNSFFRCHTGYVVNKNYVECIYKKHIILRDGTEIDVGRAYKDVVSLMN